jgi:hypothetical protein
MPEQFLASISGNKKQGFTLTSDLLEEKKVHNFQIANQIRQLKKLLNG